MPRKKKDPFGWNKMGKTPGLRRTKSGTYQRYQGKGRWWPPVGKSSKSESYD